MNLISPIRHWIAITAFFLLLAWLLFSPSAHASTSNFNSAPTELLNVYNAGWNCVNQGSGTDGLGKRVSNGIPSLQLLDTRTSKVTPCYWMPGDAGTRKDQAVRLDMPAKRDSSNYGCMGEIFQGTYTDATHFNGYAVLWCRDGTTNTARLVKFVANGTTDATVTDLVTEITTWTWATFDYIIGYAQGNTKGIQVWRCSSPAAKCIGSTLQIDQSVMDITYTQGRAGAIGISGPTGTAHDGTIMDNYHSYDLPVITGKTWFVSTAGTTTNGGTEFSPWDLTYSLTMSAGAENCADGWVDPGDTIWVRGGTYQPTAMITGTGLGTVTLPIFLAQYPGENVVIDGVNSSSIDAHYIFNFSSTTYLWIMAMPGGSFEVMSSATAVGSRSTSDAQLSDCPPGRGGGVQVGLGGRVIGLFIHDTCVGSSPAGIAAKDVLVYGNWYLNFGFYSTVTLATEGQCWYMQSNGAWQRFYNNLCGNGWLQGWQAQGSGSSEGAGSFILVYNNILFQAGAESGVGLADRNSLLGGNAPNNNNEIVGNSIWTNSGLTGATCIHYFTRGTQGITIQGNVMACGAVSSSSATSPSNSPAAAYRGLIVSGNTAYGTVEATLSAAFTDDTHATTRPSTGSIVKYYPSTLFRPDGDLCYISWFGWDGATSIAPDLIAGCGYTNGAKYQILDGQNSATILASGTCTSSCAPSVASNATVGQAWIGPNPQAATNPPVHTNASPDVRRFSTLVAKRTEAVKQVGIKIPVDSLLTGVSTARVKARRNGNRVSISALPLGVTISRPTVGIVAITLDLITGQSILYTTRASTGWVTIPGGWTVTIAGATGSCTPFNATHTTVAFGSLQDGFRIALAPAGCNAAGLAAATVLYQAASPAIVLYSGHPLATGDILTLTGGTSDWSCFNGTWTIIENTFSMFTGPTCTVTATTMSGVVPTVTVNRSQLTYTIKLGVFQPGSKVRGIVTGHAGNWVGANGIWQMDVLVNGRLRNPYVDASGFGTEVGQAPTILVERMFDFPSPIVPCSAGCYVTVPAFVGIAMEYVKEYFNSAGTMIAQSGIESVVVR